MRAYDITAVYRQVFVLSGAFSEDFLVFWDDSALGDRK